MAVRSLNLLVFCAPRKLFSSFVVCLVVVFVGKCELPKKLLLKLVLVLVLVLVLAGAVTEAAFGGLPSSQQVLASSNASE